MNFRVKQKIQNFVTIETIPSHSRTLLHGVISTHRHTHTHTVTQSHIQIHTLITFTHTHTHSHIHTHSDTFTYTYSRIHILTHIICIYLIFQITCLNLYTWIIFCCVPLSVVQFTSMHRSCLAVQLNWW
jgi:hypothetical protein